MHLLFDTAIYGFLAADGLLIGLTAYWIAKQGWRWKPATLLAALVFAWAVIFYGSFMEPRWLVVETQTIALADNPSEKIRIALISDLHVGPYKQADWVQKVVAQTLALSPDLIVLAGDFILEEAHPEYLAPLKNLHAPYGVYAVLGNHDYLEGEFGKFRRIPAAGNPRVLGVAQALKQVSIRILKNESVEITLPGGKKFLLGGVDEYWTGRASVKKTFEGKDPSLPKILAAHNPDMIWPALEENIELVLAAHTHGGQIRLPFLGPVPPIPDGLGRTYDRGLFSFKKSPDAEPAVSLSRSSTQLFITSGAGETGPRARLLVPPEIAMLEVAL